MDVEAARAQLGVGARVEAPLLPGPPDGGRHPERRGGRLALEHPLVHALVVADHLGGLVAPLGRDVVLVHVRRLDHVVVDADQDHVFHAHGALLSFVGSLLRTSTEEIDTDSLVYFLLQRGADRDDVAVPVVLGDSLVTGIHQHAMTRSIARRAAVFAFTPRVGLR